MNGLEKIKDMFEKFEDLFMTNHSCICCGREIPDSTRYQLCDSCLKSLEKIDGNLCKKCGDKCPKELDFCPYCKNFDYKFDSNKSCFYYNKTATRIVKNFKYYKKKYLAKNIAQLMTLREDFFKNVDFITFVPSNKRSLKIRGFNQAEEIAKEISKITNIPIISILFKIEDKIHQADLNMKERMTNPIGKFKLLNENQNEIKGKNILIVDDVFTTGSTLNECAKSIKLLEPKAIKTITFAKTKFNSLN